MNPEAGSVTTTTASPPNDDVEREQREARAKENRIHERRAWKMFALRYQRCVELAETVWNERLDDAQEVQTKLAVDMRDRFTAPLMTQGGQVIPPRDKGIPVPMFTPRDRVQFIKEVATALNISAEKMGLVVLWTAGDVSDDDDAADPQRP